MEVTLTNLQISSSFLVLRRLGSKTGLKANVLVFLANTENLLSPFYQTFEKARVDLLKQYGVMTNPQTAEYSFDDVEKRQTFDLEFDALCEMSFTVVINKVKLNKLIENGLELSANDLVALSWLIDSDGTDYSFD